MEQEGDMNDSDDDDGNSEDEELANSAPFKKSKTKKKSTH